jgi:DUF4097 and DUF4098 domain-containing protein YvlB
MKRKWIAASILIVALLGVGVLIALSVASALAQAHKRYSWVARHTDAFSAQADEKRQVEVGEAPNLVVEAGDGNLAISAGAPGEVLVSTHKVAYGDSQAEANTGLQALEVQVTRQGDGITIRTVMPQRPFICLGTCRNDIVNLTIFVPAGTVLDVTKDEGNIETTGIHGPARLSSSSGNIHVEQVDGALVASAGSGNINASEVKGGDVSLHSDFGNVDLSNALVEHLTVTSENGEISLMDIQARGAVTFQNNFGNISLANVDASSYDLTSQTGEIGVDGAHGKIKIRNGSGNITVQHAQNATLDLKADSGEIEFAGTLGTGPHTLRSNFGNISLSIPESAPLSFNLRTSFGTISSAIIPVSVTGKVKRHWVGTINGGGVSLLATTVSGNIEILSR